MAVMLIFKQNLEVKEKPMQLLITVFSLPLSFLSIGEKQAFRKKDAWVWMIFKLANVFSTNMDTIDLESKQCWDIRVLEKIQ